MANMNRLPPLAALRAFEAVARLGSVSKAADELHVTHGAVSQQLRVLEDTLGVSLFLRHGKRLSVTEDGRMYALRLRMALADLAEATDDVLALPREDELVLAVLPSFAAHWLVRRLPGLMRAQPALKLTLRASLEMVDFQVERVDAAIRMGAGGWEGLTQLPLFTDELLAVAAPSFNGGVLPHTPQEILACPLIRSVEGWGHWLNAAGLPTQTLNGPMFTDSNLVIEAVRQGQAITLTRRSLAHDLLQSGELVQLGELTAPYATPYWLVWPSRSQGKAKVQMFAEWLEGEIADYLRAIGGALPSNR